MFRSGLRPWFWRRQQALVNRYRLILIVHHYGYLLIRSPMIQELMLKVLRFLPFSFQKGVGNIRGTEIRGQRRRGRPRLGWGTAWQALVS